MRRSWVKRQNRTALARLRKVFEEPPKEPLARATVAGLEPATLPRFGSHPSRERLKAKG